MTEFSHAERKDLDVAATVMVLGWQDRFERDDFLKAPSPRRLNARGYYSFLRYTGHEPRPIELLDRSELYEGIRRSLGMYGLTNAYLSKVTIEDFPSSPSFGEGTLISLRTLVIPIIEETELVAEVRSQHF